MSYQQVSGGTVLPPGTLPLAPRAGDRLTVSIFYDRASGRLRLAALDWRTGRGAARTLSVGAGLDYRGAGLGSLFGGRISPPPADVKAGAFSATHVTSYDGRRGTVLGPWPASQIVATSTGTLTGRLIADAPVLWNGGANFGVWLRS